MNKNVIVEFIDGTTTTKKSLGKYSMIKEDLDREYYEINDSIYSKSKLIVSVEPEKTKYHFKIIVFSKA